VSVDPLVARLRAAGCVFAEDEAELLRSVAAGAELEALVARRVAGEPLEPLVGWVEFAGLRVGVDAGVFVPRRRTEFLAQRAGELAPLGGTVLELCCGVGAVSLALLADDDALRVVAVDLDAAEVANARRNLGDRATVLEGDLDAPVPPELRGLVDVIVANAPYVPSDEIALMPSEARDHEPRVSLDGGPDGLDLHRRLAALAPGWLRRGGALLIETSERQADTTAAAMTAAGLTARIEHDDERDATIAVGLLVHR
jgi:release factor glutamine methyltransferase